MATSPTDQINEAIETRQFVRIKRRFEDTSIHGDVLASGPRHFVMALVNDRLWYDGFVCFRLKDVRSIKPDPYATFAEAALRLRKQRRPRPPRLNLESIRTLLDTACALYPLVTIHLEKVEPDICRIGRVVSTSAKEVTLLEIGAGAEWDVEPATYRLKDITQVNFDGDYEDALALVGGPGPD